MLGGHPSVSVLLTNQYSFFHYSLKNGKLCKKALATKIAITNRCTNTQDFSFNMRALQLSQGGL